MMRKVLTACFGLLAAAAAVLGIWLSFANIQSRPVLVETPTAAQAQITAALEALCQGDHQALSGCLKGQPDLGMDRQPETDVGKLFRDAYQTSLEYAFLRDCYATDQGVAMDVRVTALDLDALSGALRESAQTLLSEKVAAAEDVSQVYDENNDYRQDFVMEVLYQAAQGLLETDPAVKTTELTLECVYENGRWWVLPQDALLSIVGSGISR